MKRNIVLLMVASLLASGLYAGTATFFGNATVKSKPEFVEVALSVKSECYRAPEMAMRENNKAVIEVQSLLKTYLNEGSDVDAILTNGGTTSPFSRNVYTDEGQRTECRDTFQQTTDLTLKTGDLDNFSEKFAMIQAQVLAAFKKAEGEKAMTFVTIGTPRARVCEETREKMEKQAYGLATKDAMSNFRVCAMAAGIDVNKATITSITNQTENHSVRNFGGYERAMSAGSPAPIVETRFNDITEHGNVVVGFEFEGTMFCLDMK